MRKLIWNGERGEVSDGTSLVEITDKPILLNLPEYDTLYFEEGLNAFYETAFGRNILDLQALQSVNEYLNTFDFTPASAHYVDENGVYIGMGKLQGTEVPSAPPLDGNYVWNFSTLTWDFIHAASLSGEYVGNMPYYSAPQVVPSAPPNPFYIWVDGAWQDPRSIDEIKQTVIESIEHEAERIRTSKFTLTSGMSAIYILKQMEAKEVLADPINVNAPLIASERSAMAVKNPTATIEDAANAVLAKAEEWINLIQVLESIRRVAKEKIDLAQTSGEVNAAFEEALAGFRAIP